MKRFYQLYYICTDNYDSQIDETLKITRLFSWTRNQNFELQTSHPLYIFLHGFIPNDLTHAITFHIKGHKRSNL
jgi:hypothetical protein